MKILGRRQGLVEGKNFVGAEPVRMVRAGDGSSTDIELTSGSAIAGSCLRCPDTPCMLFSAAELTGDVLPAFPSDVNPSVCPTGALARDELTGIPRISSRACISCGLCVDRCPVQAITLTSDGAVLNDEANEAFRLSGQPVDDGAIRRIVSRFERVPLLGPIVSGGEALLPGVYQAIRDARRNTTAQFPNLLVRNLMIELGVSWKMRRLGDTNVRVDAVFQWGDRVGGAEVEFDETCILDAPRNVLDNCAVLVARHGVAAPIGGIVTLSLPNARSEYWRVIQDVRSALGLSIFSLSVGALLLFYWEQRSLQAVDPSVFFADAGDPTIANAIVEVLGRTLSVDREHQSWFRAAK